MSESKKVKLEGESKEPVDKDQLKDTELDEVAGGAIAPPTGDPPAPDLSGRFSIGGRFTPSGKF